MRLFPLAAAAAILVGSGVVGTVMAETDQVMTQNGHDYVCTGIGKRAQSDPRWAEFPLKMVFAAGDGDYLGDVAVSLMDSSGNTLIDAHCKSPWLLAKLGAGNYKAKVTANGKYTKTVDVSVKGSGQTQVVVSFPEVKGT